MHAAQRALKLEIELLVVENFRAIFRSSFRSNFAQVTGGLHRAQT
jgi:hypothetical protein